jgi:hypothetical protein
MSAGRESGLSGCGSTFSALGSSSSSSSFFLSTSGFGDAGGLLKLMALVRLRRSEMPFVAVVLAEEYSCCAEL